VPGPTDIDPRTVKVEPGTTITIRQRTFTNVKAAPGTTVRVENKDSVAHSVSGQNFETGAIAPGASATFIAPQAPGVYDFRSAMYPWEMRGLLVVG
jgi:plastocyanin